MQANLINVPSTVQDPMYRYKMPQMKLKIEGRGNGIKTNIVNMPDVAAALNLPTEFPLRFLAYELGSPVTYQSGSETICILNGEFVLDQMQKNLDKFITKYVCCSKCTLPEITIKIIEEKVKGDCRSCGHQALLDNKHRIASFMVKFHSSKETGGKGASKTAGGNNKVSAAANVQSATTGKKKKILVLADQELKDFRPKIAEAGFPLNSKDPVVADILKLYTVQLAKVRSDTTMTPVKVLEKAYRNLKTLKIPRNKQVLYGYLIFNSVFSKNVGNQVKEHGKFIVSLWEVSILFDLRELTGLLSLSMRSSSCWQTFFSTDTKAQTSQS